MTTETAGLTQRYARGNFHIDAVQLTPGNGKQVWEWAESKPFYGGDRDTNDNLIVTGPTVFTRNGRVVAEFGDWVWRTDAGDFDVCPARVFAEHFREVAA